MSRVLVVEDDLMNARLFEAILGKRGGHMVTVTVDADLAFSAAVSGQTDLILMDVSLGDCRLEGCRVDGLQLSRRIKKDARSRHVPVILVTTHAVGGEKERFLQESQADDCVSKPIVDHAALLERIRAHLREKRRE